jgi:hypothetical protein
MTTLKALVLVATLALPGAALAWDEPARGTELRADLMDALRPMAEWDLAPPVEFVVLDLRVAGAVAFASVYAQRPGGAPIDMHDTPLIRRGDIDPEIVDGATIQALLQRAGRMWVPVHFAIGATDVWYAHEGFCPIWGSVLPEICDDKN